MIEFTCEHCGKTIRYPDSHTGKQGRCPACGALVLIPRRAAGRADDADLARAVQADLNGRDAANGSSVPPPPQLYEPSLEDLELEPGGQDPFGETDIIPSDQIEPPPPGDYEARRRAARAARVRATAPPGPGLSPARRVATLAAIVVMVLLIAIVSLLLLLRR
jgi:DNA-directed RNA polymerase subunit RPC12/RpoP